MLSHLWNKPTAILSKFTETIWRIMFDNGLKIRLLHKERGAQFAVDVNRDWNLHRKKCPLINPISPIAVFTVQISRSAWSGIRNTEGMRARTCSALYLFSVPLYVTACLIANYTAEVRLCPGVTSDLYNELSVMSALINFRFVLTRSWPEYPRVRHHVSVNSRSISVVAPL